MVNFKFLFITFLIFASLPKETFGQGCSDAGICSISSFKPLHGDSTIALKNMLSIGAFFGNADNSISVFGNYIDYSRSLNSKINVGVKLTTLTQNGNEVSEFGLSDVFINSTYHVNKKLKLTLGAKLPLSKASTSRNEIPLPMDYQASLGTVDLILGVGYELKKLQLVLAYQQPLSQNENEFFAELYPMDSKLATFQTTNNFQRSTDVLLRISYPIEVNDKLSLTPSLLPIVHLRNDKYTDDFGIEKEITGSEGLTLNSNLYLDYKINKKNALQLNLAAPFVVRDARPDGLTRSFIATVEYKMMF